MIKPKNIIIDGFFNITNYKNTPTRIKCAGAHQLGHEFIIWKSCV